MTGLRTAYLAGDPAVALAEYARSRDVGAPAEARCLCSFRLQAVSVLDLRRRQRPRHPRAATFGRGVPRSQARSAGCPTCSPDRDWPGHARALDGVSRSARAVQRHPVHRAPDGRSRPPPHGPRDGGRDRPGWKLTGTIAGTRPYVPPTAQIARPPRRTSEMARRPRSIQTSSQEVRSCRSANSSSRELASATPVVTHRAGSRETRPRSAAPSPPTAARRRRRRCPNGQGDRGDQRSRPGS